jgi:hypothetical protein
MFMDDLVEHVVIVHLVAASIAATGVLTARRSSSAVVTGSRAFVTTSPASPRAVHTR